MSTALASVPRTKKAAISVGLLSELQLSRGHGHRIAHRDAVPIIVKGEAFYREDQLEALVSRTAARRQGFVPATSAVVYRCYSGRKWYDAYRESDCIRITEEHRKVERAARRATDRRRRAERTASQLKTELRRKWQQKQIESLTSLLDPNTPVVLPELALSELEDIATKHAEQLANQHRLEREAYVERCLERGEEPDDGGFGWHPVESAVYVHRVSVNYLRHVHTDYDRLLRLYRECEDLAYDGVSDPHFEHTARLLSSGIRTYRDNVYAAIATTYPHLQAECDRQQRERDNRSH